MTQETTLSGVSGRIVYGRTAATEKTMRYAFEYTANQMNTFEKILTIWADGPWAVENLDTADEFVASMNTFIQNLDAMELLEDEHEVRSDWMTALHLHLNPFLPEDHQLSEEDQHKLAARHVPEGIPGF